MYNKDGSVEFIWTSAIDITKEKELLKQLTESNSELGRLNRLFVGREIKMSELKKENEELKKRTS